MLEIFEKIRFERRKKALEKDLPSAMNQAAILSSYLPIDEVICSLSAGDSVLSGEFKKIRAAIEKGEDPETALKRAAVKNKSELFEKAADILGIGCRTGAKIGASLVEVADDISERFKMQRESEVGLMIQKYTLLLAAGFIVPVILGLVSSFSQNMQLQFSGFGILPGGEINKELASSAVLGTKIYVGICAVLSSFFVTYLENKKFVFAAAYISILLPCSLAFYGIASTLI